MTTKKFTANIEEELSQPEKAFMSDAQEVQEAEGMEELKNKLPKGFIIAKDQENTGSFPAFTV